MSQFPKRYRWKFKFFPSRVLGVLSFFAIIYASLALARITWQNYKIDQKIIALNEELEKLSEENFELKNKIAYYKTNSYRERLAREKLNLQKPGEIVIVITPSSPPSSEKKPVSKNTEGDKRSNYQKWRDYFFGEPK